MNESQQKEIAAFRFSVISDLIAPEVSSSKEINRLIREKADSVWVIPYSDRRFISESTIRRWRKQYLANNGNIEALYPNGRIDSGSIRAMEDDVATALVQTLNSHPQLCVTELVHRVKQMDLIPDNRFPSLSTIYRFLRKHKQSERLTTKTDRRRFEAEFPNDIWQSDVMHGPRIQMAGKRQKTYLIAFLDDHSRLIPHAAFYPRENVAYFLEALKGAVLKRGLPRKLYVDNGPAFRSKQLSYITAALAISLIHAKPFSPQGKGKVERFFRTVRKGFLSTVEIPFFESKSHPLMELNESFDIWLHDRYHQVTHSATGQSPLQRFTNHIEMVRPAPDKLSDYFRWVTMRTVTKDRVVHLDGNLFETPVDLCGERIELLYHPGEYSEVEARFLGKSYGLLKPINLNANVKAKRGKNGTQTTLLTSHETSKPRIQTETKTGRLFNRKRRTP